MSEFDKPAEQVEEERREAQALRDALIALTDRVPADVRNGTHTQAVQWKKAAVHARKLAEQKLPKLDELRKAHQALRSFETSAA